MEEEVKNNKNLLALIILLVIVLSIYTFELISLGILKKNEGKRLDEDIVDKEIYYTISFDEDNGNEIKEEKQKVNEKIKLYTPSKEGYVFLGWLLNDDRLISDNYIVTSDIKLKAKWLKENEVYIIESIPEYDDSKEQDRMLSNLNNIQSYEVNVKYKDENVNIEIMNMSKFSEGYIKVNNEIIYDISYGGAYISRLFTFNGNYVVHLTSIVPQCPISQSFIISENGELLGKITGELLGPYSDRGLTSNIITYYKDTNIIKDSYFRAYIDRSDSPYKVATYKIEDNQLKIINTIMPKEDTYYIYDEFGNYKTLPKENRSLERVEIDNRIYYFAEKEDANGNTIEIYDNNLNKLWIITGLSDRYARYVVNANNTITFNAEKDGVFVVFDSNMNLVHESKNYEIVGIVSDYVIVIKDGKARIIDLEENEVAVFDELPSNFKTHMTLAPSYDYLTDDQIRFYVETEDKKVLTYSYDKKTKEKKIEKNR